LLITVTYERRAIVELIYDLEDRLLTLLCGDGCREEPANPQVDCGVLTCRDERIGCLLETVVEEGVGAVRTEDEPGTNRLPERLVNLLLR
jgi:hypothetical protein